MLFCGSVGVGLSLPGCLWHSLGGFPLGFPPSSPCAIHHNPLVRFHAFPKVLSFRHSARISLDGLYFLSAVLGYGKTQWNVPRVPIYSLYAQTRYLPATDVCRTVNGVSVLTDEPLAHHYHLMSTVHVRVRSWCRTSHELRQMYDNTHPPL